MVVNSVRTMDAVRLLHGAEERLAGSYWSRVLGWLGNVKPQEACNPLLSEIYPKHYEGINATKDLAVQ